MPNPIGERKVRMLFTAGFGRDAYNGGVSNIYFDSGTRTGLVTPVQAEALLRKMPKNFQIVSPGADIEETPATAAEAKSAPSAQTTESPKKEESSGEPVFTRAFLETECSYQELRKAASELATEDEKAPRSKEALIDFILQQQRNNG